MKWGFLSNEAKPLAERVAQFYLKYGYVVAAEKAFELDAPLTTTLTCKKGNNKWVFVEVLTVVANPSTLYDFASWLDNKRINCETYLAVSENTSIPGATLAKMKNLGIGLIIVHDDHRVDINQAARNPALQVSPDPSLSYGTLKNKIIEITKKFNSGERKNALQELCELAEGLTSKIAQLAVTKKQIKQSLSQVMAMDWSDTINTLSSANSLPTPGETVITDDMKTDLHALRNGRNLVNHKTKTLQEENKRTRHLMDRMPLGFRIISELLTLRRKLQRLP